MIEHITVEESILIIEPSLFAPIEILEQLFAKSHVFGMEQLDVNIRVRIDETERALKQVNVGL